jgi:hypothetical protein
MSLVARSDKGGIRAACGLKVTVLKKIETQYRATAWEGSSAVLIDLPHITSSQDVRRHRHPESHP